MRDDQFREILGVFGLSWDGYRRVRRGVKKHLRAHMVALGSRSVKAYLERLEGDGQAREEAERLMTVSMSRFFRDKGLWQALEFGVLPGLVGCGEDRIRVWSAGCACGEEAYSLRIVWQALCDRCGRLPDLELWATDANRSFLEKARDGIYGPGSLKELPDEWRASHFSRVPGGDRFSFSGALKEGIRWRVHDLVREEPPASGFHLVLLRNNLLTYYEKKLQVPAFQRIVSALRPGGVLILGKKERLPGECGALVPLTHCPYAFEKVAGSKAS
jgi:chemotaxis protein methyltransferase CheR